VLSIEMLDSRSTRSSRMIYPMLTLCAAAVTMAQELEETCLGWLAEDASAGARGAALAGIKQRAAEEAADSERYDGRGGQPRVEKLVVLGGGPAGLAAAIYAARAGLQPLVVAPIGGGQLLGKGVEVENYPGLLDETGPGVVQLMRRQARAFETVFLGQMVQSVDLSARPFTVTAVDATVVRAEALVVATGADSKWLGVPGEQRYRGGGVSSCATCDGYLFRDQPTVVIGGGDTAMEEALVLARTASSVTVLHRRDAFRASVAMQRRVLGHPKIEVVWNATVASFEGGREWSADQEADVDRLAHVFAEVRGPDEAAAVRRDFACRAAFVAIGHHPNTELFRGQLAMAPSGYLTVDARSTRTSVPGVFAAGDVADDVYRQAITSAGSGAAAALDAERWLSEHAPPPPPLPPPPLEQAKDKAGGPKRHKDCASCVGAGFGWSAIKQKCGGFANTECDRDL
jgi:thioredoxin-disulfide reductase